MDFKLAELSLPNFENKAFKEAADVKFKSVEKAGVAPDGFYLTGIKPTFYKLDGKFILPRHNSLNCVAVVEGSDIIIKEIRNLEKADKVVVAEKPSLEEGIFIHEDGFADCVYQNTGKAVESSFSKDYDRLFKLLDHEKNAKDGYIVWVLGPSVVFDYDTRAALNKLAENGYIDCLLGGNAMATHDLEGGFLNTALGQNIYTQENAPMGHYNHLDLLNEVRAAGSIKNFIETGQVKDGIVKTLVDMDVPLVLSGSIRDDGPLPEVIGDTDKALDETKKVLDKATVIICIATMLHSLSVINMAPSYKKREDGKISPVYTCGVDVTENVINKLAAARENLAFTPMVTNVQDFVVNLEKALVGDRRDK